MWYIYSVNIKKIFNVAEEIGGNLLASSLNPT